MPKGQSKEEEMIYVALTNSYISGVFDNKDQAEEYVNWCNVGFGTGMKSVYHSLVDTGCIRYPFYAMERGCGYFEFYQIEENVPKDLEPSTLYRFGHGYQAPAIGQDFMGLLDHEHFGDEE